MRDVRKSKYRSNLSCFSKATGSSTGVGAFLGLSSVGGTASGNITASLITAVIVVKRKFLVENEE